jgi:hypothetical protein
MDADTRINIDIVKREVRPGLFNLFLLISFILEMKLSDWTKYNYAHSLVDYANDENVNNAVERVDGRNLDNKEFMKNYEMKEQPIIITNAIENWPAMRNWTIDVSFHF